MALTDDGDLGSNAWERQHYLGFQGRGVELLTATVMLNVNGWTLNWSRKAAKPGSIDDKGVTTNIESCIAKVLPLTTRPERPVVTGKLTVNG